MKQQIVLRKKLITIRTTKAQYFKKNLQAQFKLQPYCTETQAVKKKRWNIKIHTHTHTHICFLVTQSLRQEEFTELPTTLQLNKQVLFSQFTSEADQGSAQNQGLGPSSSEPRACIPRQHFTVSQLLTCLKLKRETIRDGGVGLDPIEANFLNNALLADGFQRTVRLP